MVLKFILVGIGFNMGVFWAMFVNSGFKNRMLGFLWAITLAVSIALVLWS